MGSLVSSIRSDLFIDGTLFLIGTSPLVYYAIYRESLLANIVKATAITTVGTLSLHYYTRKRQRLQCPCVHVIVITGCDTGLGYSFAKYAHDLGFIVFAGFLDVYSDGAKQLRSACGKYLIPLQLDIRDVEQVQKAGDRVREFFKENPSAVFHALINNAGVMVFGEFDWQTNRLIEEQIEINLLGTMRVTQTFLPFLRHHKGRIMVIGSHCADVTLPGLTVYGATKAALHAWCDGIRLELAKYGVQVIKFVPGSFITQSKILTRLPRDREEIENNLSDERKIFYNTYIEDYYNYLMKIPTPVDVKQIDDNQLYRKFESALTDRYPKALYKHEPLNYTLNHFLFKITPTCLRDYLVCNFVRLPSWKPIVFSMDTHKEY